MEDTYAFVEDMLAAMESDCNFLRGLWFDQRIPQSVRDAIMARVENQDRRNEDFTAMLESA